MGKGSQKQWAALRQRLLTGGGRIAAEARRLASLPPDQLAEQFAQWEAERAELVASLDDGGETDRLLAELGKDDGLQEFLARLTAEEDAVVKPAVRELRRQERLDSKGAAEILRRAERADPAADAAEDATAAADLQDFLAWQRRRPAAPAARRRRAARGPGGGPHP